MISQKLYASAKQAAIKAAIATGRGSITRVAVLDDNGNGFSICSRAFYEEGCSESEWIGQAISYIENGVVNAGWED